MFGFVVGALAVAWGVLAAYLEQPGSDSHPRAKQLCTGLLTACTGVTVVGGLAAASGVL